MTSGKQQPECIEPRLGALLVSYVLETLSESEAGQFEQHLLHCPACQQELEEASAALETLSEARGDFVHRAHAEKEDFESLYEQLLRAKQKEMPPSRGESRAWLEAFWSLLWGRRWVLGSVAAVVFAILVGIKQAPEFLPHHEKETASPSRLPSQGMSKLEPRAEAPLESGELEASKKSAGVPRQAQTESNIPRPSTATSQPLPTGASDRALAKGSIAETKEKGAGEVPPSEEDQVASVPLQNEEQIVSSARSLTVLRDMRWRADTTGLAAVATLALGRFNPANYRYSKFRDAEKVGYYALARENEYSKGGLSEGRQPAMATADSLLAAGHYREAQDIYQQGWSKDSTDVALGTMIGLAALAQGNYEQAGVALSSSYARMSPGTPRLEVALLLARADILGNRMGAARVWLREAASSPADSQLSGTAQRALIVLDSLQSVTPPDSTRK